MISVDPRGTHCPECYLEEFILCTRETCERDEHELCARHAREMERDFDE